MNIQQPIDMSLLKWLWLNVKNKWSSNWRQFYLPYLLLISVITIYHLLLSPELFSDDIFFSSALEKAGLLEFLNERYNGWSSRLFIEAVLVIISQHMWLWVVLDILVYGISAITLAYLTNNLRNGNYFVVVMALTYPFMHMWSAGWMTTTLNYLWPITALLIAFIPVKRYIDGHSLKWFDYLLFFVPLLFAISLEQGAGVAGILLVLSMGYLFINKKKIPIFLPIGLALNIIQVIAILASPGNAYRLSIIGERVPILADFTLFDKFATFLRMIEQEFFAATTNLTYISFCVVLFVVMMICCKGNLFAKIAAFIPCIIWAFYKLPVISSILNSEKLLTIVSTVPIIPAELSESLLSGLGSVLSSVTSFTSKIFVVYSSHTTIADSVFIVGLQIAILIVTVSCNVYSLYVLCKGMNFKFLFCSGIFATGMISYLPLCTSYWFSINYRTSIYLCFALIFIACYIYALNREKIHKSIKSLVVLWLPVTVICLVNIAYTLYKLVSLL